MKVYRLLALVAGAGVIAQSQATIFLYSGQLNLSGYGDRVVSPVSNFGECLEGQGWTPNVVADHLEVSHPGLVPLGPIFVWLGGGQYGDMYPGIYCNGGNAGEIRLTADPTYTVQLHEFHMGGWPSTDQVCQFLQVTDQNYNVLWTSGATHANPIEIEGQGHSTFSFDPPLEAQVIRIQWGTHDSIGIGRISFSQYPAGRFVTGNVDLLDFDGDSTTQTIEVEVRAQGTSHVIETSTAVLSSTGEYTVATGLSSGSYDIAIKGSHWLRKSVPNVSFTGSGATASAALTNGDCDGDNEVGIGDYALVSGAYNAVPGDGNWDASADLNGDESVDIGDYAILSANYGLMGDE